MSHTQSPRPDGKSPEANLPSPPATDPERPRGPALRCAERIRRAVEEHRFARVGPLSVSAGVAASPRDGVEGVELLSRAEQALSVAKKSGRRRVMASAHAHVH